MKSVLLITILAAFIISCSNQQAEKKDAVVNDSMLAGTDSTAAEHVSLERVIAAYLQLKNALAGDNPNQASQSAKDVLEEVRKIEKAHFTTDQKKIFDEVKEDMKEHAEHISENAGNIAHQREHFDMLSKDMLDLVKQWVQNKHYIMPIALCTTMTKEQYG